MSGKTQRADKRLVELGLCSTRSKAQQLIQSGAVLCNGKVLKKASEQVGRESESSIEVLSNSHHYVGRGALKMQGAYEDFELSFEQKIIVDIGASTGGFTQFALEHGAKKVYALDVGKNQLGNELLNDSRVVNMEGINIRYGASLPELVDMAVVDLSFISLRLCLQRVRDLVRPRGELVVLYKPQFELGREALNSQGVVKSQDLVRAGLKELQTWCSNEGLYAKQTALCKLRGKTGNQEYFLHLIKESS